jgi:hypothetical protein
MNKKRKIAMVATKVSFEEAEEADNLYWANTNTEERLNTLFDLRMMLFGNNGWVKQKISKVVFKRSLYEEAD